MRDLGRFRPPRSILRLAPAVPLLLAAALGCGPPSADPRAACAPCADPPHAAGPEIAGFGSAASFALDKAALRARGASPRLLEKLDASAYRYFRMLGPAFASRTCWHFRDLRWHLPLVAVHGDAHLEQFVVTRETYGLEDFDQSGYGPMVVDLVRYAASLRLACQGAAWPCRAEDAVSVYLRAYRRAIAQPPDRAPIPRVVERLRRKGLIDADAWLRWADALMRPLPPAEEAATRKAWAQFADLLEEVRPDRPASFYEIVRVGALEMGLGSALEHKVLLRLRGETDAPGDDLVLEAREWSPPVIGESVWRPAHGGALHVLLLTSILGRRMPAVHGFVALDPRPEAPEFWVQAWDAGYKELSLADLESQADLEELAEDAARQLAGHFWTKFPEELRGQQRVAQLRAFDLTEARARQLSGELVSEVLVEWERFRRAR